VTGQGDQHLSAILGGGAADREPPRASAAQPTEPSANGADPAPESSTGRPTPRPTPTGGGRADRATQPSRAWSDDSTEVLRSPGALIAERYRLLAQAGADRSVHAEFWRARDTVLERDVGLTLLCETGESGQAARAVDMIARALRWGRFEHVGCARLLDVMPGDHGGLPQDVLGLAVTEWVPGRGLAEAVAAGPLRTGVVLSMLEPLVQATEAAHQLGLVLGCTHPQRIRVTPEGKLRLAFTLPDPDLTSGDDVIGLGALLYVLLTGHWPLSDTDAEPAGLPPAPRDLRDVVVPPGVVRPGVSLEVSALAQGALGAGAPPRRILTAAGVHKVLAELLEAEREAALLPPPDDGAPATPDEVWRADPVPAQEPDRRRKLSIGMAGLGLGMIVVLGYVGAQVGSALGITGSSTPRITVTSPAPPAAPNQARAPGGQPGPVDGQPGPVDGQPSPVDGQPSPVDGQPAPAGGQPAPAGGQPGAGATQSGGAPAPVSGQDGAADHNREAVVRPNVVRVYDPTGDPDNAGRVSRAVDDDPVSSWSTYIYRRPFPALKPGVGVMVSFSSPVQLSTLTIASPSQGSQIEIRSAPAPDAAFNQTIPIGAATVSGQNSSVSLAGSQPVQNVLVWITKLGGGGDQNVTVLSDLRFERVTG
jgi:hypothetical protein